VYTSAMADPPKRKRAWGKGREKIVTMRLTESERVELQAMADAEGLSLADFMRAHLFSETVTIVREIET